MKVVIQETSPTQKEMEVTLDVERVDRAYSQAFKRVLKKFSMPGFRKGKVPANLARKYITDEGLTRDVIEALVPRAYQEALDQQALQPLSEPSWDFVQNERGKELIFKAKFEVKPEVELPDFRDFDIIQERLEVGEEQVLGALENMRERQAQLVPLEKDRGLEEGDVATVDYSSRCGEEILEGQAENYLMEVKKEHYIEGFIDNLYGLKAGEEKTFNATFPDDYGNEELAGKEVTFDFNVQDIKLRKLPELDDEFAQSVSEHETLEELKKDIETRLTSDVEQRAKAQAAGQILAKLLKSVPKNVVPQSFVALKRNQELRREARDMQARGLDLEAWLETRGVSKEQWFAEMQARGLFEARIELAIDSVARSEKLEVDAAEIDTIIEGEAKARRMKPKKLRASLQEDGSLELLKYELLRAKVQDFLVEQGSVTYVLPGEVEKAEAEAKKKAESQSKKSRAASKKKKAAEDEPASSEEEPKAKKKSAAKKKKAKSEQEKDKAEPKAKKKKASSKSKTKKSSSKKSKKSESES